MAGTATKGKRVAAEGAAMGGAAVEAPIVGVRTVALVSMGIKFLRLLKMHPAEGRKKMRTTATNASRNTRRSLDGMFGTDDVRVKSIVGWGEQNRLRHV